MSSSGKLEENAVPWCSRQPGQCWPNYWYKSKERKMMYASFNWWRPASNWIHHQSQRHVYNWFFLQFLSYYFCVSFRSRQRKHNLFKELGIPGPTPNLVFGNLHSIAGKVRASSDTDAMQIDLDIYIMNFKQIKYSPWILHGNCCHKRRFLWLEIAIWLLLCNRLIT